VSAEIAVVDRQRAARVDRERVRRLAAHALRALGLDRGEVGVLLVGDRRIRELNRRWRGLDRPTDVLSFSQREGAGGGLHPDVLGDVVVSVPTAVRQAGAAGLSLAEEIDRLVIHGILHLAGHEHEGDPRRARAMRRRRDAILRGWGG
jgi:probable rRNA maturation factor